MLWINFLHWYQPANSDAYKIKEAIDLSYLRMLQTLENNPSVKFTFNISACLVSRFLEMKEFSLIERINNLIARGQIELVGSASHHALLPLIDEKEVQWQIKEQERIIKLNFPQAKLKGFFLPEMAYSPKIAKIIKKNAYSWIILDQISYQGKKKIDFTKPYIDKNSALKVIFRSRNLSNSYIPSKILSLLEEGEDGDLSSQVLITASDGELYGLRHNDTSSHLEKLLGDPRLKILNISKYLEKNRKLEKINLRKSSWESSEKDLERGVPFHLWQDPRNEVHQKLWDLSDFAGKLLKKYSQDNNYYWSHWHFIRGLASCTFWWASAHNFEKSFGPYAWSPDEIERGVNELIRSIRSLEKSSNQNEKMKAENLLFDIRKVIWTKHWTEYAKKRENKINKLLDEKYVISFLSKKILPLYPDFKKIERVKIISHKNHIWETTYHVVFEFKVTFSYKDEDKKKIKRKNLSFFTTAHSSEPRKNVYDNLNYLWNKGFSSGFLTIPKPLFYSKYFNASFYRGVMGDSLLDLIKDRDRKEVEKMVKKTAEWLVKLHRTPLSSSIILNKKNNKIKTVIPGYKNVLKNVSEKHKGVFYKDVKKIYDYLIELEDDFFDLSSKRWLVHGDVHPENIIKMGAKKIALIDFTDICASDFTRDLGTFLQQIEHRLNKELYPKFYIKKIKEIFLETYCQKAKIKYNIRLKERIDLYYHWTALRTAIFWLLKYNPKPERAELILKDIKKKLKII